MQGVYSVDCHPTMSKVAIGSGDGTVRYLPFRGGLVFKAHRLLYYSTLGLRVIKKKQKYLPRPRGGGVDVEGLRFRLEQGLETAPAGTLLSLLLDSCYRSYGPWALS